MLARASTRCVQGLEGGAWFGGAAAGGRVGVLQSPWFSGSCLRPSLPFALQLVFCQVCCDPFHIFCLEEDEQPLPAHEENWCCRRCKFCHVCGRKNKATKARGCLLRALAASVATATEIVCVLRFLSGAPQAQKPGRRIENSAVSVLPSWFVFEKRRDKGDANSKSGENDHGLIKDLQWAYVLLKVHLLHFGNLFSFSPLLLLFAKPPFLCSS